MRFDRRNGVMMRDIHSDSPSRSDDREYSK